MPDSDGKMASPSLIRAESTFQNVETQTFLPTYMLTHTKTATTPTPTRTMQPTSTPAYFSGAGDISICGQMGDEQTAEILLNRVGSGLYFSAGDSSNESGLMYEYQQCFGASWGQLLPDLRVVPGNHDYYSNPLENYWIYFYGVAGEPGKGWYSFKHGDWHIVMLNSNCGYVGCSPSSEQIAWLKRDLTLSKNQCSLAIWHHPRFNSGIAGNADWLYTFWDVLYEHGVDVVVNGHDHHYERMTKINPQGEIDRIFGVRSFIVGTGGASYYGIDQIQPFSEVRITDQFGIIQFELKSRSYAWQFINVEGEVMDFGSDVCSPDPQEFELLHQ
ncbi:MAG: metallophosphoesterase [Anaerolineaceae bacterium]|nr:metallophosphoesterase [Anaerolineaceae bacterium]